MHNFAGPVENHREWQRADGIAISAHQLRNIILAHQNRIVDAPIVAELSSCERLIECDADELQPAANVVKGKFSRRKTAAA